MLYKDAAAFAALQFTSFSSPIQAKDNSRPSLVHALCTREGLGVVTSSAPFPFLFVLEIWSEVLNSSVVMKFQEVSFNFSRQQNNKSHVSLIPQIYTPALLPTKAGKHCPPLWSNSGTVKFKTVVTLRKRAVVLLKHKDGCSSLTSAGIPIRLSAGVHHASPARLV